MIDFLEEGVYVYPYGSDAGQFTSRLRKASTALGDSNSNATAMAEVYHKGDLPPVFYATESKETFQKEIKAATTFSFAGTLTAQTGLTEYACSSRSECISFSAPANTAFSFNQDVKENAFATCMGWKLQKCGTNDALEDLDIVLATLIAINPNTGEVSAPTGLKVGEYVFTITATNQCCASGSYCIKLTIV